MKTLRMSYNEKEEKRRLTIPYALPHLHAALVGIPHAALAVHRPVDVQLPDPRRIRDHRHRALRRLGERRGSYRGRLGGGLLVGLVVWIAELSWFAGWGGC